MSTNSLRVDVSARGTGPANKRVDGPFVSVIIGTRNRPKDLARCLPTVLANDYERFEVLVVDQSPSDESMHVVKGAVSQRGASQWRLVTEDDFDPSEEREYSHRLVYRHTTSVGIARGQNEALAVARGEIIAITDDDCTVPSDWLRRAVDALVSNPAASLMYGAVVGIEHDPATIYLPEFRPPTRVTLEGRLAQIKLCGMGANMVIRRSLLDELNGFDECLGPGSPFRSGADIDIAYRTLRAGHQVHVDPEVEVVHWGARSYEDGSARTVFRNCSYGVGARQSKYIRCGDPLAMVILLREFFKETFSIVRSVVQERRASGAGRLAHLVMGAINGLRQPVDRERCVYQHRMDGA